MLRLLSSLYGFGIRLRNLLYDTGAFRTHHTPPVVVSVGNIEVGGTGKTPFTLALARTLVQRELNVAIVTRGYKGRISTTVRVQPSSRVEDVGDEALLMARALIAPVIKSPDRVAGALYAWYELGAQVVIMDDAFQHRRIYRDLDIVLVAGDVHSDALLPLGRLREPVSSLGRADFIVNTKGSSPQGPSAHLVPQDLVDVRGRSHELTLLRDKKVLAVCAIARPEIFFSTLEDLGARVEPLAFRDHHQYTGRDIKRIQHLASGTDLIVTTEKDLVKLSEDSLDERWLALRVELSVPDMKKIAEEIVTIVKNRRIPRQG